MESATKTITIRHESATAENVLLLVRCMYENWVPELMDAHAFEIVQMAVFYDCRNVVAAAIQPIIRFVNVFIRQLLSEICRQLTTERFWKTAAIAVQLQAQQPTLFDACVDFAYCAGTLSVRFYPFTGDLIFCSSSIATTALTTRCSSLLSGPWPHFTE